MVRRGRALFRADASLEAGTGHVMRCLTLAGALRERGVECRFISRDHPGHLGPLVAERGHQLSVLPQGREAGAQFAHSAWLGASEAEDAAASIEIARKEQPDWLVVDHYALGQIWEARMRPHVGHILAIDDLADRAHDCDLLVDQNLARQSTDYAGLVPDTARVLIGTDFAMLRPEFAALRESSLMRARGRPFRLLIALGGADKDNFTTVTLEALRGTALPADTEITVVLGAAATWLEEVREVARTLPWRVEVLAFTDQMASLMARADASIGAAGLTTWERCCLGVPSALWVLADNQRRLANLVAEAGAAVVLDPSAGPAIWRREISAFLEDKTALSAMRRAAAALLDGQGVWRVVSAMELGDDR